MAKMKIHKGVLIIHKHSGRSFVFNRLGSFIKGNRPTLPHVYMYFDCGYIHPIIFGDSVTEENYLEEAWRIIDKNFQIDEEHYKKVKLDNEVSDWLK